MPERSAGKARGLAAASSSGGIFTILAIDHRDSMRVVLDPEHPEEVASDELTRVKLWLLDALASECSAVLLDPEYGITQAVDAGMLADSTPFLAAIEAQGYRGSEDARVTKLLEGWGVGRAKAAGASGIKLLLPYRPDAGAATEAQDALVVEVVEACAEHDIPFFLEPVGYAMGPAERRRIVVDSIRRLGALGPDVLKVQFPVDMNREPNREVWGEACAELEESSPVPWVLLSGGDPYELFLEALEIACINGASGFVAGRSVWREAVAAERRERAAIMESTVGPRLRELAAIATSYGRDWAGR